MRWKFEREDLEIYRCCFCFHVRTGTLLLGILDLLGHILGLAFLIIAVSRPELIEQYLPQNHTPLPTPTTTPALIDLPRKLSLFNSNEATNNNLPVDLGDVQVGGIVRGGNGSRAVLPVEPIVGGDGNPQNLQNWVYAKNWSTESLAAAILLTVASMIIALCLIYGTIRGIAKYITPFFCVQMFDLCLSGLTMLSYFSDLPAVRRWIAAQSNLPFKDELLAMDNDHLTLLTLIIFVGTLSVKAYFIGVVWACYKYLRTYEALTLAQSVRLRVYDTEENHNPEDTEMLLPPKYEDVIAMPAPTSNPPPPPYGHQ